MFKLCSTFVCRRFNVTSSIINKKKYSVFKSKEQNNSYTMDLKLVVRRLEEYAPLNIAVVDWDNVGLLVEPTEPLEVKRILLTNDLTEPVLEEAISKNVNLIISYHPAIFKALKRLTQVEWKQRSIVKCIEKRIAVFCPHTSWDSVDGGINDWILQAFSQLLFGIFLFK